MRHAARVTLDGAISDLEKALESLR